MVNTVGLDRSVGANELCHSSAGTWKTCREWPIPSDRLNQSEGLNILWKLHGILPRADCWWLCSEILIGTDKLFQGKTAELVNSGKYNSRWYVYKKCLYLWQLNQVHCCQLNLWKGKQKDGDVSQHCASSWQRRARPNQCQQTNAGICS